MKKIIIFLLAATLLNSILLTGCQTRAEKIEAEAEAIAVMEADDINCRISRFLGGLTTDFESVEQLYLDYRALSNRALAHVVDADKFESNFIDFIVDYICSFKTNGNDTALELTKKYSKILSDSEIEECLLSYGQWRAVIEAENYFKDALKNPHSYRRYSAVIHGPTSVDSLGLGYRVTVDLEYGGTNSFGGVMEDTVEDIYTLFDIDFDNIDVEFSYVGFSPVGNDGNLQAMHRRLSYGLDEWEAD